MAKLNLYRISYHYTGINFIAFCAASTLAEVEEKFKKYTDTSVELECVSLIEKDIIMI